jgi:adenine deaminase
MRKNKPTGLTLITVDLHEVINHAGFLAIAGNQDSAQETFLKPFCYSHSQPDATAMHAQGSMQTFH